jgi:transcriptional regulator with XRE-family HTH domain
MRKDVALPIAVQNLRRIWEAKKIEMQFNQTGAAKELGWTQGAISHYLNNITELGPPAIVKLANFLDVDPTEIDPSIVSKLPYVRKINVTKKTSDLTSPAKSHIYDRDDIAHIYVAIDNEISIQGTERVIPTQHEGFKGVLKLCRQSKYTSNHLVAVRLKTETHLRVYLKSDSPPAAKVHTLWAVMSITYL